jgi:hypothetical protein
MGKFEKVDSKTFFTSLLKDLSMEDLVTLGNLLSTKFMEPNGQLYATLSMRAWVPQDFKNKVIKTTCESSNDRPSPETMSCL